jgi:biopolymer transport protein ExbD
MASIQNTDEEISGINVTPLVDVTLVLLIIFMVTAKLIAGQGIPLDLPKAKTAGATQTVLNVSIDADGAVLANGSKVQSDVAPARRSRTTPSFAR